MCGLPALDLTDHLASVNQAVVESSSILSKSVAALQERATQSQESDAASAAAAAATLEHAHAADHDALLAKLDAAAAEQNAKLDAAAAEQNAKLDTATAAHEVKLEVARNEREALQANLDYASAALEEKVAELGMSQIELERRVNEMGSQHGEDGVELANKVRLGSDFW